MKITIIAEIGVNHNGKVSQAKKIILKAKKFVKIVKFQFYRAEDWYFHFIRWQNIKFKITQQKYSDQLTMLKKYEFSPEQHIELSKFCTKIKLNIAVVYFMKMMFLM